MKLTPERRRADDQGQPWKILAHFWSWIDERDIDKHLMAWAVFGITCYMLYWVMEFVWLHPDKPGLEVGAIVAALMVPWTPVQAAVVAWYFRARTNGDQKVAK